MKFFKTHKDNKEEGIDFPKRYSFFMKNLHLIEEGICERELMPVLEGEEITFIFDAYNKLKEDVEKDHSLDESIKLFRINIAALALTNSNKKVTDFGKTLNEWFDKITEKKKGISTLKLIKRNRQIRKSAKALSSIVKDKVEDMDLSDDAKKDYKKLILKLVKVVKK